MGNSQINFKEILELRPSSGTDRELQALSAPPEGYRVISDLEYDELQPHIEALIREQIPFPDTERYDVFCLNSQQEPDAGFKIIVKAQGQVLKFKANPDTINFHRLVRHACNEYVVYIHQPPEWEVIR